MLWSPTLPFVGSNDMIRVFRHAVSLDEACAVSRMRACKADHRLSF